MAAALSLKRLALDTNVLLDRARGRDFAVAFIENAQRHGFSLHITYTVAAELDYISQNGTADEQEAATTSLNSMLNAWDIKPIDPTDLELDYRKNFVAIVAERNVLPPGEVNDARILAETAIASISMLVTSDQHILSAGSDPELWAAFSDAGLENVTPVSCAKMAAALQQRP
jgi:predicted nucleic acid-binding protein